MLQAPPALRDNSLVTATWRSARTVLTPAFRLRHGLLLLERALVFVGIVLLGWYALEQLQIAYDQAAASRELEEIRMPVPISATDTTHPAWRLSLATGAVVGRVEIPRIGVSAVVREGDDVKTLRRAVGHIPGTALPGDAGNTGLAGHRDTFFRGLRNIQTGDQITLTTPAGNARYRVRSTRVVDPSETSVLAPTTGSALTLVTCYPFNYIGAAPKRFVVRAEIAH
jgi:LPXTG-site transpeptidase (sortase) family protein